MTGNSNNKTNFSHELLLTKQQFVNLCKAFKNNWLIDIKVSKA